MGIGGAETARLIASLELQDKNFTRGLKNAERRLGKIDKKLGAFSGAVNRNVARGIDSLVTHGIDAGQAVIQAAIDQESAIVGIRKTVDGNVDAIVEDLKKMSVETGSTFEELASIAETGGAMGIRPEDIAAFTKQVAILGATTNVTIEDAATAIGQMGTIMGITGDEFDNLAASLVDLGNKGNSTEAQILEIAKRSGAAAKTVGIAKDEFLGWASAAANLGLGEELAGTALQKFFVDTQKILARGGKDLKTIGKISGMTGEQFKKAFAKDASGALSTFIDGLKDLNAEQRVLAIEDLFGKGSGMTRLLLGLSEALDDPTSGLTASLETNAEAWKAGTAAQTEADKRFKSSEFSFKRLNNAVNLAAATIGTELLPVLVELAEEGIDWLMQPATQKALKSFAVDLGKGLRGVVTTLKGVNWGGFASALGTAAGFAGDIAKAFLSLPPWVQALAVGGFAVNKLTGGLLGDIFKAKLGITAGTVFVNGPVAGGGGVPVPGGKGGGPLPATLTGRLTGALKTLLKGTLTVAVVGAALVLWQKVADDFGKLQTWLSGEQGKLDELIEKTSTQDFQSTLDNLNGTVDAWNTTLNPLQQLLSPVVAGGQIEKDFEMAADRVMAEFHKGNLSPEQMKAAIDALKKAQTLMPEFIDTPKLDAAILTLAHAIETGTNPGRTPGSRPGDTPPKTRPAVMPAGLRTSEKELANIKSAVEPLPAGLRAAEAQIGNVKTAVTTMNADQKANAVAAIAATTAGNLLSVFQSASQVLAQGSTTTAVGYVAPPIVSQLGTISGNITAAIWASGAANKPVIQSTNVVNNYTTQQRTGSTSGSRNGRIYNRFE